MLYLGSDHAGFKLKQAIKRYLSNHGYEYEDLGNLKLDKNDDYPDFGARVAKKVSEAPGKNKGILICGSAEGMGMVANKFRSVRAAVVYDKEAARLSREHNDANILSISGWKLTEQKARAIVKEFLETKFSGAKRHKRRLAKTGKIEKKNFKK
ncbi:RpiB/LacA/LacB family sugar-phosphate isomerase [Patescibacteria group bacterium]|nr:RpiB/LacA/LacB family sugar-phosphate isomerase [Patescibacteria group bacterium]